MKKIFSILLVAVACFALSSCGVKKGYGSKFYGEPVSMGEFRIFLQHSTMHCPAIKNGTNSSCYHSNIETRNTFCSKCMDEELIEKWHEWIKKN
jgi:hypothetical protein